MGCSFSHVAVFIKLNSVLLLDFLLLKLVGTGWVFEFLQVIHNYYFWSNFSNTD